VSTSPRLKTETYPVSEMLFLNKFYCLKLGCLHPVACTRSGSGFLSNATLFPLEDGHTTETCSGY
jgi:hypothetical protein